MQPYKTAQKTVDFYNLFLRLLDGTGKPNNSELNLLREFNLLLILLGIYFDLLKHSNVSLFRLIPFVTSNIRGLEL